jgi:hypothetical protein
LYTRSFLFPGGHPDGRVVYDILEQLEIAAGREGFARTRHNDGVDIRIVVDIAPDIRELGVGFCID